MQMPIICILFCAAFANAQTEPDLEVSYFENNPGVIFEEIGIASLTNVDWQLLIYSDLSVMKVELSEIRTCIEMISKICNNMSKLDPHCSTALKQLSSDFVHFEENEEIIFTNSRRERRGLVNGIGLAAHYLFGTLSSEDADYYNSQIDLARKNENHLMSLIKNQTSIIIDTTVGVLKTSHEDVTNRFDVISRKIETLKNTVDKSSVVI